MIGRNIVKGIRGKNVTIAHLHRQIKQYFPKSDLCQKCNKVPPFELVCIRDYNGDLNKLTENWAWMCHSCHTKYDYDNGIRKPSRQCAKDNPNLYHSDEMRRKMSLILTGRRPSIEARSCQQVLLLPIERYNFWLLAERLKTCL